MDDKITEVREANNIVDVISSYIPLIKKGKNYFGVCPFHDDTNPSMSVSEEKQIYKCFSCGASGNVFNFVMDYEHVEFKEALKILADRAGIKINNISTTSSSRYDKYYKMYDLALKMYQNNLNSSLGKEAKEYLKKRGLDEEIITRFKIGLSTSKKDELTKILNSKDYTNKEIELYGLGNGREDLYINRIMFPLSDIGGKVVGFSGRIYNTSSQSKYINTKETPIFKKGELLYNYYDAKDFVRKEKNLIIVEGFMDVIRLYKEGIKNVIALMGTSLTKNGISLIKRLSTNIYLSLDGDGPGKKAVFAIGEELIKAGMNVKVITIPNDKDPDEYVLENGIDSYKALLSSAISYSDYKINFLKEGKNLTSLEDKTKYINEVLAEIAGEKDDIKKELLLNKVSKEFEIDTEILRKKLQKLEKNSKIETLKKGPEKIKKLTKYDKASIGILYSMLNSYEATKIYEVKLNYLPDASYRYLANEIVYYYKKHGTLVLADFITSLEDKEELSNALKEVIAKAKEDFDLSVFEEYILVIKGYNSNRELERLNEMMLNEPNDLKKALIAEKIRKLKMGAESDD